MNIPELQSLLAHNRTMIAYYELEAVMFKDSRKEYVWLGELENEYFSHNMLQKTKAKIAKLVKLQKSLKQDLSEIVELQRNINHMRACCKALHEDLF